MADVDRAATEARPSEWIAAEAEKVAERVIEACRTAGDVHLSVVDAFCLANLIQSLRSGRADSERCDHPSSTGDEGSVNELGSRHVVRWRCDGCGDVHYSDEALAAARAEHRSQSAEVERLGQLPATLAWISATVTASYPGSMDPELVLRRRLGKVNVEAGELADAVEGYTGENPRKGVYASREDVVKELIDCASAALCALEFMTGDRGESLRLLAAQVESNRARLAAAVPVQPEPQETS